MKTGLLLNHNLDDSTRLSYLQALGITVWSPKEVLLATPDQSLQTESTRYPSDTSVITDVGSRELTDDSKIVDSTIEPVVVEATNRTNIIPQAKQPVQSSVVSNNKQTVSETQNSTDKDKSVQHKHKNRHQPLMAGQYLKVVKWSNPLVTDAAVKKVMIICRHQIDQPANSFARMNGPSQFMTDYIAALNALLDNSDTQVSIQLAHLSAAGLSADSQPLSEVLSDCQPDLILALGEETINQLFGEELSVASARGKLNSIEERYKVLSSYHPFSLIKNPSLKRLALEDLVLISQLLTNQLSS